MNNMLNISPPNKPSDRGGYERSPEAAPSTCVYCWETSLHTIPYFENLKINLIFNNKNTLMSKLIKILQNLWVLVYIKYHVVNVPNFILDKHSKLLKLERNNIKLMLEVQTKTMAFYNTLKIKMEWKHYFI